MFEFLKRNKERTKDSVFENIISNNPLPIAIFNSEKKLQYKNKEFSDLFENANIINTEFNDIFKSNFNELFKITKLTEEIDGRTYMFLTEPLDSSFKKIAIILIDVSESKKLEEEVLKTRISIVDILVDSYDEIMSNTPDNKKGEVSTNIETTIRNYAKENKGSVIRYKIDKYFIVMPEENIYNQKENKFQILENIKKVPCEIPITISMGIGIDSIKMNQLFEYASEALELARGRGGDQAIVKSSYDTEFYGGNSSFTGRRDKGRSRVIAYSLVKLIKNSDKVIIMSHKNMDADAFGASIGLSRLVKNNGKKAYIVKNKIKEELHPEFEKVEDRDELFISAKKALSILRDITLVIVVDTQFQDTVENTEILKKAKKVIIIDHHLTKENTIKDTLLSFLEPFASSSSELVTELLQYDKMTKRIPKNEAEFLLSGIIVDTNRFAFKTGKRTFEAATFLKDNGASEIQTRKLLQISKENFREKVDLIENAEINKKGFAFANAGKTEKSIIEIAPIVVDELLEIKGVIASFIVYEVEDTVYINARSLNEVNVGVIMEKFGGGGHRNVAASQIKNGNIDEVIKKLKEE